MINISFLSELNNNLDISIKEKPDNKELEKQIENFSKKLFTEMSKENFTSTLGVNYQGTFIYKNDLDFEGYGIVRDPNFIGEIYLGHFKQGRLDGAGIRINKNDPSFYEEGLYSLGTLVVGTRKTSTSECRGRFKFGVLRKGTKIEKGVTTTGKFDKFGKLVKTAKTLVSTKSSG